MTATRRSHRKSRRGCTTCKRRHIKCDEAGPPCGSCQLRATTCEYPDFIATKDGPAVVEHTATENPVSDKQTDVPVFPASQRLQELHLMSRWCVVTYKSCCTEIAEDHIVWQKQVPDLSLQYDYLLNGLLALSAFEIASTGTHYRTKYVDLGHHYQGLALSSFRVHLPHIGQESFEASLCFSMMLMVLALASAQFGSSSPKGTQNDMVQRTLTHFELVRGCEAVIHGKEEHLLQLPFVQKLRHFEDLAQAPLDPRVEMAVANLNDLNEKRIESSVAAPYEHRLLQVSHWKACKAAIGLLRELYAKCDNVDYSGYILAWLNLSGDEFIEAIKTSDHVALLALAFWGVLAEKLSHQVWWAKDFGRLLIEEIFGLDQFQNADQLVQDLISSARELIGSS